MAQITENIIVDAPQSRVWAKVADLGGVQAYHPAVRKSYYISEDREGIGAARVCELAPFGKIEETATEWVHGNSFTLEITPIEKMPPVKEVKADIRLHKVNEFKTEVRVTMEFQPQNLMGRLMIPMLKKQFSKSLGGMLSGLKVNIEKGKEVYNFKALRQLTAQLAA